MNFQADESRIQYLQDEMKILQRVRGGVCAGQGHPNQPGPTSMPFNNSYNQLQDNIINIETNHTDIHRGQ